MQQTDQKINSGNQSVENSAKRLVRQLLTDNYSRYYSLAYSYVRNEEDAMDIVQEGAYKALRNSGSLRNPEYAGTWIYRIMIDHFPAGLEGRQQHFPSWKTTSGIYRNIRKYGFHGKSLYSVQKKASEGLLYARRRYGKTAGLRSNRIL